MVQIQTNSNEMKACTAMLLVLCFLNKELSIKGAQGYDMTKEEKLLQHLFTTQRDLAKFVPKLGNGSFYINLLLTIKKIHEIKSNENVAELTLKFDMEWRSDLTKWNASVSDLKDVAVDASSVWTPKFSFEESSDETVIAPKPDDTVYMSNQGTHRLSMNRKIKMTCNGSTCLFPKDSYNCSTNFTLLRFQSKEVKFMASTKRIAEDPGTWTVVFGDLTAFEEALSKDSTLIASGFRLTAKIERKPLFHMATVVAPLFLLGTLSCLSVILPATTGDRIALLMSCLLAAMIYLETTFQHIPVSSTNFPLLIWVIIIILVMTGLQIVLAGICLNWANKEEHKKQPGKKFLFIIFIVFKFVFVLLPTLLCKIKGCVASTRKRRVGGSDNKQVEKEPAEDSIEIHGSKDEPKNKEEVEGKNYRLAIKMVDSFSILLGLIVLAALSLIGYIAIASHSGRINRFCDFNIGLLIA